jgi:hypothetical protein
MSTLTFRFLIDQHHLLKTLVQVDEGTFPFQQHLKVANNLLLLLRHVCFPPFGQLISQQVV